MTELFDSACPPLINPQRWSLGKLAKIDAYPRSHTPWMSAVSSAERIANSVSGRATRE
jgi:hypothetical protein